MILDDPSTDVDPSDRGDNWQHFQRWLPPSEDKTVSRGNFLEALQQANDGGFGFGEMGRMSDPDAVIRPSMPEEGVVDDSTLVKLDECLWLVMEVWLEQFDNCKDILKRLFQAHDVDHDEVLEITEFIALLKTTPMRIRQVGGVPSNW